MSRVPILLCLAAGLAAGLAFVAPAHAEPPGFCGFMFDVEADHIHRALPADRDVLLPAQLFTDWNCLPEHEQLRATVVDADGQRIAGRIAYLDLLGLVHWAPDAPLVGPGPWRLTIDYRTYDPSSGDFPEEGTVFHTLEVTLSGVGPLGDGEGHAEAVQFEVQGLEYPRRRCCDAPDDRCWVGECQLALSGTVSWMMAVSDDAPTDPSPWVMWRVEGVPEPGEQPHRLWNGRPGFGTGATVQPYTAASCVRVVTVRLPDEAILATSDWVCVDDYVPTGEPCAVEPAPDCAAPPPDAGAPPPDAGVPPVDADADGGAAPDPEPAADPEPGEVPGEVPAGGGDGCRALPGHAPSPAWWLLLIGGGWHGRRRRSAGRARRGGWHLM